MKITKRFVATMMSVILTLTCVQTVFANDNKRTDDSYSLGELQNILICYLEDAGYDIEIGTPEFYDFAVEQLIYGSDKELASLPQYSLIHGYLAEYKLAAEDEIFAKEISEVQTYSTTGIPFYENTAFLARTIGEIKESVAEQDMQSAVENLATTYASYTYDGEAAAAYARKYGNSYNNNYPSYSLSGGDCTNFVSQALYAGGIPWVGDPSTASSATENTTTKWYCTHYSGSGVSYTRTTTSWIRVSDFATYMSNVANLVQNYTSRSAVMIACEVGSVVQLRSSSTNQLYHSIIISKKNSASDVKYCGHSSNCVDKSFTSIDDNENNYTLYKY